MYKILSIDGGGIRGIIPARLLERLEVHLPGLVQDFDLFAGTSTGAVLAAGFAYGFKPRFMRQMYRGFGEVVFKDSYLDNLLDLGMLLGANYSLDRLKALLERVVGDTTLGELEKNVLITTFDLKDETRNPPRWKPKFFHNYTEQSDDNDQRLIDVVLSSVAAPVYFPIYKGYIDGGVVTNNPSTCALAQAYHEGFREVRLLSLGTGTNPRWVEEKDADWGVIQWGFKLVNIVMDGVNDVADYQCRQILKEDYFRMQPVLRKIISMDAWQSIGDLISVADAIDLEPLLAWIEETN
jgi:patatin-like phospholipase/acyl hydrolase